MPTKVVFFLLPKLHLLDLAGPAQVFSTANDLGHGYDLYYVAEVDEIVTAQGIPVKARLDWPELGPADLIVVPGWRSPRFSPQAPLAAVTKQRLRTHHAGGGQVASVCSGADALGAAGLLDGRRYTTHHDLTETLAARYPKAQLIRDVLYVEDDRVITSAGIASGIDLALHLVAVQRGAEAAARVAREMVVYARRNGDELQESAMLRHRGHVSDLAHRVQDVIDSRYADQLRLAELASGVGVSERTLTRVFTAATGLTPLRYQQILRLERAENLIGHGTTIEAAARAVGFEDARMLRRLRSRPAAG
ncbi:helix-turn-helix domain-containing protein [Kribbella qitaiheensis]|uniref:Helix-turn-helix domain-containing protein n=1 Tax=Kribbella qitaiheensis TaxID=1544730 RepID=A0A7G6WZ00_9ACTN|nr:DJ-1/PfpI family protein [Kribbella qitaiheensis]QNE19215.1 helix-turn-helix domain-containing protein [Kribbella qitaiheensis]